MGEIVMIFEGIEDILELEYLEYFRGLIGLP